LIFLRKDIPIPKSFGKLSERKLWKGKVFNGV